MKKIILLLCIGIFLSGCSSTEAFSNDSNKENKPIEIEENIARLRTFMSAIN